MNYSIVEEMGLLAEEAYQVDDTFVLDGQDYIVKGSQDADSGFQGMLLASVTSVTEELEEKVYYLLIF